MKCGAVQYEGGEAVSMRKCTTMIQSSAHAGQAGTVTRVQLFRSANEGNLTTG